MKMSELTSEKKELSWSTLKPSARFSNRLSRRLQKGSTKKLKRTRNTRRSSSKRTMSTKEKLQPISKQYIRSRKKSISSDSPSTRRTEK